MSTKKLQIIIHRVSESYIFKLLLITASLLLIIFCMLETKEGSISFVYNNF